ncbi:ABC transporter permease [Alphaproteobacteria bacterium]|nr:ABC transporter permease [Alphaproteobacteria bacterium]
MKSLNLLISFAKYALSFVIAIGLWEAYARFGGLNELFLPRPSKIGAKLYNMFFETGMIYWHFYVTMAQMAIGFTYGIIIGNTLAVLAAFNESFRRYIAPYAVVFNVTPGIAVLPLIIAWFGFGWESKIALATLVCFFPPFINTLTGLLKKDDAAVELFQTLGASKYQFFWKQQLPNALPEIFAGLKLAITTALLGTIVAQFGSATEGVGILMQRFAFSLDMAGSFASLVTMALMGLMVFTIAEVMDRRIVFWRDTKGLERVSKKRSKKIA